MKNEETNKEIRLLSEQELGEISGAGSNNQVGWPQNHWINTHLVLFNQPWYHPAIMW
jgi:hypothetical protein